MTQTRTSSLTMHTGDLTHRLKWAAMVAITLVISAPAQAQMMPSQVAPADYDFTASGYVTPAGMVPPEMYYGGVAPVGYATACDAGMGCVCGGCDSGSGGGGLLGKCGLLGGGCCSGCGPCGMGGGGCSNCGCGPLGCCFNDLRALCGNWALPSILPYAEGGICAQRWYDLSVELALLGHSSLGPGGTVTTLGEIPGGTPVLDLADVESAGLEAGVRVSGALLCTPGGNIEATYIGGNEWTESAQAFDANGQLFSVISDFGQVPPGGFSDTDNSSQQSLLASSRFHSAELNFRQRTVGPCCRFQGSWLVGLRYLRFDHEMNYSTVGDPITNPGSFFNSSDDLKNSLFGAQLGGDLWWNVIPGVNFGVGMKGMWLNNDSDRVTSVVGSSVSPISAGSGRERGTVAGEVDISLIYRVSHSWSLKTSWYALAIDDVAVGTVDVATIQSLIGPPPAAISPMLYDSVVIQGWTIGAEYLW